LTTSVPLRCVPGNARSCGVGKATAIWSFRHSKPAASVLGSHRGQHSALPCIRISLLIRSSERPLWVGVRRQGRRSLDIVFDLCICCPGPSGWWVGGCLPALLPTDLLAPAPRGLSRSHLMQQACFPRSESNDAQRDSPLTSSP